MAIASLSRFTVPLASDQSASTQGLLMPKLKYRFRVTFEGFGVSGSTTELTKQVMTAARPTAVFAPQKIEIYNSTINYAGKATWNTIVVKLRDDVNGNVSKLVGEQMQRQFDFFEQSAAAAGNDYKFTTRLEILDGGNGAAEPTVLETWELYGCFLKSADYGQAAYNTSEPLKIALVIRYDNANQTPNGAGVGSTIARTVNDVITG